MMTQPAPQPAPLAPLLRRQLAIFLAPLLARLDHAVDARLVRTVHATVVAILCWRHRPHGLLLSELGAVLASPAHAPAGTGRFSNLLRFPRGSADLLAPAGCGPKPPTTSSTSPRSTRMSLSPGTRA